jgi:ADP-ribose pyrophosphatase YjhB (NUDIX family)
MDELPIKTINGLIYNKKGKLLFLKDKYGTWDLPGGRLDQGESFKDCFKRETQEELGVTGHILDIEPAYNWISKDIKNRPRQMLCFNAALENFNFKKSDECVDYAFYSKEEIKDLNIRSQTKKLLNYL